MMMLEGKVNAQPTAGQHESSYNVKLTTRLGYNVTVGYTRHKDPKSLPITHAWVAFGVGCTSPQQKEEAVNFLLNIVGYKDHFGEQSRPSRWQAVTPNPENSPMWGRRHRRDGVNHVKASSDYQKMLRFCTEGRRGRPPMPEEPDPEDLSVPKKGWGK